MRLTQRISVDLPEPEGPHTTIFSPRATASEQSSSAWNVPYHLCTPSIASRFSALMSFQRVAPLQVTSVGGDRKADGEIDRAHHDVHLDRIGPPFGVHRQLQGAGEVVDIDDRYERGVFYGTDEQARRRRDGDAQRLWQHNAGQRL